MYIGSTGQKGLHHLIWEIVDNCVDEIQGGYATKADVEVDCDSLWISVTDDGRGIPTDPLPGTNKSALETVLTVLHAGGKFGAGGYSVSGGLHGVGLSVVNALSEQLEVRDSFSLINPQIVLRFGTALHTIDSSGKYSVTLCACKGVRMQAVVWRDSKEWVQQFAYGKPTGPMKSSPADPAMSGTKIRFKYDPSIFSKDAVFDPDVIRKRLRELAFLNSNATLGFKSIKNGEQVQSEEYHFTGGIAEYVQSMTAGGPTLHECVHFKRRLDSSEVSPQIQILPCIIHDHDLWVLMYPKHH